MGCSAPERPEGGVVTETMSLAYLFAHPESVSLSVRHPELLLALLVIPVFLVRAGRGTRRQRWALLCRGGAYGLVALALAGVALSARLPSDRLSVVVAVDRSESIDAQGRHWQQRYLDQIAAALAPGDELGAVVFAKDARVARPPGRPEPVDVEAPPVSATATDIGAGLQMAMSLFPPETERRLVLLSDGNETRGSATAQIARATRAGVSIYAAVPPHTRAADVSVEKVAVAPLVAEGSVFPIRVILRNQGSARQVVLSLLIDDEQVGTESITLQPGLNAVEVPYRMTGPGSHRLRAQVQAAGDAIPGNNYRDATLMIGGKSRVLLVSPRPRSPLADVLQRKDFSVTTISPNDFPTQVDGLLGYHCVVFEDVTAAGMNARRLEALERYVKDFGGGFIVAAGERTFGDTAFKKTPFERVLPITLEPRQPPRAEREPLALFILIDHSNSMGYHIRNRLERSDEQSKLAYAKRAALAVVNQLKDSDYVGLIVFDSQPFEVAPLRALKENRAVLLEDIPRLQPGGGTDFYDALESARAQLVDSRIGTKHAILLTDGDTNRGAADHYPLIAALAKADISVTTIRIGDDTVNLTLLNDISSRTGGQFYHVENVETLPELLLKDTTQALAQAPQRDQTFAPRIGGVSQALRGIKSNDLPDLNGYAYSRAKPGADVMVYVLARDKRDPVLAAWQYGLGRVATFTASLDDDAETWVGWEGFGKLWSQVVHWVVREQTPWDYALAVQRVDGQATLTLHSFEDEDDGVLMARVFPGLDQPFDVPFVPRAPREFVARIRALPGGRYPLTITKRRGNREAGQRTELVTIPEHDEEPQEEFEADHPNLALLSQLTAGTGGAVDAPLRTIVGRKAGTRRSDHPLDWLFIPAAMLLFLADVGLRRLVPPRPS
jgi:Ca-activated chloride channel family protein